MKTLSTVLPAGVRVTIDHDGTRMPIPLPLRQPVPAIVEWEGSRATARVRLGKEGTKGSLYTIEHHELARCSEWFERALKDAGALS